MTRHASTVTFPDGHVMVTLFDACVDLLYTRLVDSTSTKAAWDTLYPLRDTDGVLARCTCGQPSEEVTIHADYYGETGPPGDHGDPTMAWKSAACRRCLALTGPRTEPILGEDDCSRCQAPKAPFDIVAMVYLCDACAREGQTFARTVPPKEGS